MSTTEWGRVDDTGTVFVRHGDDWRAVGQYPDTTGDEALAFFVRKFQDIEGQVRLLEQRVKSGAKAADLTKAAAHLRESIDAGIGVGDFATLSERLTVIESGLGELSAQQQEANKAELDAAIAQRETIVAAAESLAARDPQQVQWKALSAELDALFGQWKTHQSDGPRLPKSTADALWKRFRAARTTIEQARRSYFSELDAKHKDARVAKQALVERARALSGKGADGIPAYRALLDEWKAAGRAGRKVDDALWAEFKEAGDVLFAAKADIVAAENTEYSANLEAKRELLGQAQPILGEQDRAKAREQLTRIQRAWDEIGRVPREAIREVEDGLRKVEAHVKGLDDAEWQRSNPERKARSAGLAGQLEEAIEKLEAEKAATKDAKRQAAIDEEIATKRSWLDIALAAG